MLVHVVLPCAQVALHAAVNLPHNLCGESRSSRRRVENLHTMVFLFLMPLVVGGTIVGVKVVRSLEFHLACVGKAHRELERILQNIVHRVHHKIDNRLRCVINAAGLFLFRIVMVQEIFVEMNQRVALAA